MVYTGIAFTDFAHEMAVELGHVTNLLFQFSTPISAHLYVKDTKSLFSISWLNTNKEKIQNFN